LKGIPFIYTIASPMTQALHGISDFKTVYRHMREDPDALKKGLRTITDTCKEFVREAMAEGADGIFLGIAGKGDYWSMMNRNELEEWTLKNDKEILETVDLPISMLHICNTADENPQKNGGLMLDGWFKKYPVKCINWWDKAFVPAVKGKEVYGDTFCIATGLPAKDVFLHSKPEDIMGEAHDAIRSAGKGGGFFLTGGCTISVDVPKANYNAVGRAAEKYGRYND
jgi:uroporphyrinogen decarboxylase